jgi:hypothetical protein
MFGVFVAFLDFSPAFCTGTPVRFLTVLSTGRDRQELMADGFGAFISGIFSIN